MGEQVGEFRKEDDFEAKRRQRYQEFHNSKAMLRARAALQLAKELGLQCDKPEMELKRMLADWDEESQPHLRNPTRARVSFCQVVFGRGWQLRASLPLNMMMLRRHLGTSCRIVIMLYDVTNRSPMLPAKKQVINEDYEATLAWIRQEFQKDLAQGHLVVYVRKAASFHSPSMKNQAIKAAIMTPWMEGCQAPRLVEGEASQLWVQGPFKKREYVPAEQMAHQYGTKTPASFDPSTHLSVQRNHLVVNVDADNILPDNYYAQLCDTLENNYHVRWDIASAKRLWVFRSGSHADSGCAGRVGCLEFAFMASGGYDEDFEATGYQDIDFFERLKRAGNETNRQESGFYLRKCEGGCSIPNDKESKKAKGEAKIEFALSPGKWHLQNEENRRTSVQKLADGLWYRNIPKGQGPPKNPEALWRVFCSLGDGNPTVAILRLAADPPPIKAEEGEASLPPAAVEGEASQQAAADEGEASQQQSASSSSRPMPKAMPVQGPPKPPTPDPREQLKAKTAAPPYKAAPCQRDPRLAPPKALPYKAPPCQADPSLAPPHPGVPKARKAPPEAPSPTTPIQLPRAPAPVPLHQVPTVRLRIVSVGLMELERKLQNILGHELPKYIRAKCKELHWQGDKRLHQEEIKEDLLTEVLQYAGLLGASRGSCIVMDLRGADDPEHDKRLRGHLGTHPSTMLGVSTQQAFKQAMRKTRKAIWLKFAENPEAHQFMVVVAYCKKGNHRSVAFAKLLEMVSRGYTLAEAAESQMPVDILVEQQELIHINDAAGFWQTQKCLKCPVCSHDDAFLTREYNRNINVALQNALDAWSGASKSLML